MVSRGTAYDYWHSPCRAAMKVDEGTWSAQIEHMMGGYMSAPVHKDTWVALKTTSDWTVIKASASTDKVIGQLVSEPQGEQIAVTRYATVLLLGQFIKEVEIHTSSDSMVVGSSVMTGGTTGYFNEGVWTKDTTSNGSVILVAYTTGSAYGTTIPVLFGYAPF
jgi:hypothetical protein